MDFGPPRPPLQRKPWPSLHGPCRFRWDDEGRHASPADIGDWPPLQIRMPDPPEAVTSGLGDYRNERPTLIDARLQRLHGTMLRDELSACTALRTITRLRNRFMLNGGPYTLCLALEDQEWHLHAQSYPPYRARDRLQYLAGTEIAAGFFAMDALPEDKAAELQQVQARF